MARKGDLVKIHWEDAFAEVGVARNTNWAKYEFPCHDTVGVLAYYGKRVIVMTSWEKDQVDVVGVPRSLIKDIVVIKTKAQMGKDK